ncbi:MAG TPA: DUF1622 domain-containing protein [Pyrinomonadaceae bacterium]|nr:DUF1622 domain-containing protein [Pyrinomonadaceae bacterium]
MEQKPSHASWSSVLLPTALILGLVLLLSLNVGQQAGVEPMPNAALEPWLKLFAGYLGAGAEIAAALVIGAAVLRAIVAYLTQFFRRSNPQPDSIESIRLRLGRVLALGLEFTIASDILRTAVAPTRQDIMNLGAIVLLRTLLNYFLEREIRMGEERRASV